MPERDDRGSREALTDELGRQREVVILHEDDRILRVDLGAHGVDELAVHLLVVLPVLGAEGGARVRKMAERPETFVGEAVIVALLFGGAEPHAAKPVGLFAGGHADPPGLIRGVPIR